MRKPSYPQPIHVHNLARVALTMLQSWYMKTNKTINVRIKAADWKKIKILAAKKELSLMDTVSFLIGGINK